MKFLKVILLGGFLLVGTNSFAADAMQLERTVVKDIGWIKGTGGRYVDASAINAKVPESSYDKVQILVPIKDEKKFKVVWESKGAEKLEITFGTGKGFYDFALYINGINVRNMPHLCQPNFESYYLKMVKQTLLKQRK